MAQSTPLATSSPVFKQLAQALKTPEPMCLVIVMLAGDGGYAETAEYRIRENMRSYDQLWRIDEYSYALTLKTLADAKTMTSRIERLFLLLAEPYAVGQDYAQARVQMGASVRLPQDTPGKLLDRVGHALDQADTAGCVGPIIR
jgi:hypothetical protein